MPALPLFTTLGSGPTLLMLHGVGGGHLSFAPQVETFASAGYRAVAWDMPGYGRSAPIEPYTFKGLAQSCVGLIEALRCGTVTLIGQGMGGRVAQEVVARRPELVDRLVLCGTTARAEAGDAYLTALAQDPAMAGVAERVIPQLVGPGSLPEGVRLATHCMAGVHPSTLRKALQAQAAFDRQADLSRIRVPTLLIAGEFDREADPAGMRAMARSIAGSTYVELPGIGHLQNLEAPESFDERVLNFLALPRVLH
jgi:pimeloyl-ACP methyl ester carboxylesterase